MKKMKTVKPEEAQEEPQKSQVFQINRQYIKESSFESPNASVTLASDKQHKVDLTINIDTKKMDNNNYEVTLHLTGKSISDGEPIFMIDLAYAGLFTLPEVEEEQRNIMLFVLCPNLLFPFARHILADTVRDGGFPPLMLNPIDFMAMYKQKQEAANKSKAN